MRALRIRALALAGTALALPAVAGAQTSEQGTLAAQVRETMRLVRVQ